MEPIEVTLSDGEETFVLVAVPDPGGGWSPWFFRVVGERRMQNWPAAFRGMPSTFPTPGRCLLALAEVVVAELCGVRT